MVRFLPFALSKILLKFPDAFYELNARFLHFLQRGGNRFGGYAGAGRQIEDDVETGFFQLQSCEFYAVIRGQSSA